MKRQHYFPKLLPKRPEWFLNYARQLLALGPQLGLSPNAVGKSVADALYLAYVSGVWMRAVREFGPACTAALERLNDGPGAEPVLLPVFSAPPMPSAAGPLPATVPVPPGALQRLFAFVQVIKSRREYTREMGLQLGIVGEENSSVHRPPWFSVRLTRGATCDCVRFHIRRYGHKAVVLEGRRGNGNWETLGVIMSTTYVDARPLLQNGVPEVRHYRMRFYDDSAPNGDYTEVTSLTVGP